MVPVRMQVWARGIAERVVRPLARRGITPNTVTVLGFIFNLVTAGVLATGHLTISGILLLFSGLFDMLDGALARITNLHSVFGAFLDSLLDRYSEVAVLLALIVVYTIRHDTVAVVLVYAVAVGSLLISYSRARAEGLGLDCKVGIAPRPERIMILGLGLLFSGTAVIAALVVLAVLTHVTALQRLYHVWRQTHPQEPRPGAAPETPAP